MSFDGLSECLKTHTSGYGTIRTQRVVNSSHECTFIIQQPQSYVIYLQFQNFHVGNDTVNCTTNYVEVGFDVVVEISDKYKIRYKI